jgi:hypothetical protein
MNDLSEYHGVFDHHRRFLLHVGVVFVTAASQVAGAQQSARAVTDAEILPAILQAASTDAGRGDVRVDPRPLAADVPHIYDLQTESFAQVAASVIHSRAAIIRGAGLRIVDTTVVNQSRNCPGTLVVSQPDSLSRAANPRIVGCPEEPFHVLAVGPPRPGIAAMPEDGVYDRVAESAACGYWAVRVVRTTLGYGRAAGYAADYVLAERAGKWVVVKTVGLMYSH